MPIKQLGRIESMTNDIVRIVITNSHADNRGDEAAQRSLINSLNMLIPNAKFTVLTFSPKGLQLQGNVRIIKTFSASLKKSLFIVIWIVFRLLGVRFKAFAKRYEIFEALEEMANADVIISAPGGPYFGDLYAASHEIQEHLLHILLSKFLGKPVMIYGPSMGPFKAHWRNIIRRQILKNVEIISLRDPISFYYLKDLKLTRPLIYLTADSALQDIVKVNEDQIIEIMIAENIIASKKDLKNKFLVGITPTGASWNYRNVKNPAQKQKKYNRIMANTINYLIDKYSAKVIFFPQLYGNSNDMPLINQIVNMVDEKDEIKILSNRWNSEIQQAIISQMDLFIGNRYHSVIFALKSAVPTVCLAYEHKAIAVMNTVKLSNYVIKINDLTYEILIDRIEQLWRERKKIRKTLESQIKVIRNNSLINSLLALALVNCTIQNSTQRRELEEEIDKLMVDFQQGRLPLKYEQW